MNNNSSTSASFSSLKKAVHDMVVRMFKHYDPNCFRVGIKEIIADSKAEAIRYRDKILAGGYELKAIELALNKSVHEHPKKEVKKAVKYLVPDLRTILINCNIITEHLKDNGTVIKYKKV